MTVKDKIRKNAIEKLANAINDQCDLLKFNCNIKTINDLQMIIDLSSVKLSKEELDELGGTYQPNLLNSEHIFVQFCKDNDIDISCWKTMDNIK